MNDLEQRYASPQMAETWSPVSRAIVERGLWVMVMRAQGVDPAVIDSYQQHLRDINLESIRDREATTGHDLKARLEEFNALAGHQAAHIGLTSSDITETSTAWQVHQSSTILTKRIIAVSARLAGLIGMYGSTPIVGRTHNRPAQVTTLGLRFAHCVQDLSLAFNHFRPMVQMFPFRGMKGAIGTSADLLRTLNGDIGRLMSLEGTIATTCGFGGIQTTGRQTSSRATDAAIGADVLALCAAASNCATTIRLMVGQDLATESPHPGQVGSSAMPHKVNPRFAERVCGLLTVVRGYAHMLDDRIGDVWNEGDITDSCVRRVALPGLFLAADGLLRTFMVALDRFDPDLAAITAELQEYRFETQTGQLLTELAGDGMGREDAHRMIADYMWGRGDALFHQIGAWRIQEIVHRPWDLGAASQQCEAAIAWCQTMMERDADSCDYDPGPML